MSAARAGCCDHGRFLTPSSSKRKGSAHHPQFRGVGTDSCENAGSTPAEGTAEPARNESMMSKHDYDMRYGWGSSCRRYHREVLPARSERVGRLLRRSLVALLASAAIMVGAQLWAHQVHTRHELVISVPTPVPWMCEDEHHMWQRCWWATISAAPSTGADANDLRTYRVR